MVNLANYTHQLFVQYQASMDPTPSGILPPKIPSNATEGFSKTSKGHKKKKQDETTKEVPTEFDKETVPTKTGKGVIIQTKTTATKPS